ncbi:hypothetical protein Salat_0925900 [Sesamum alatum]|uniref:Uncharacterized protein n=1 Tax=Sesamum alatum TaxID=300844 RepID=A0AAE1YLB3_9LAMI|nr:hypothetical protein Salat_0925900 [Sesamum alatum]
MNRKGRSRRHIFLLLTFFQASIFTFFGTTISSSSEAEADAIIVYGYSVRSEQDKQQKQGLLKEKYNRKKKSVNIDSSCARTRKTTPYLLKFIRLNIRQSWARESLGATEAQLCIQPQFLHSLAVLQPGMSNELV